MDWDTRLDSLRVRVDKGQVDYTKTHWRIIAAWLTSVGNWDDVPTFAKKYQLDTLGGDHHAFGQARYSHGSVAAGAGFVLSWPDGAAQRTPELDGWANIPLEAGFDPLVTSGPYAWQKYGNAESLVGLGLPFSLPWKSGASIAGGNHVSYFAVWQETEPDVPLPPSLSGAYWLRWGPFKLAVELEAR